MSTSPISIPSPNPRVVIGGVNSNDDDSDDSDNNDNERDRRRPSSSSGTSLFADLDGLTVGSLPSHYLRRGPRRRQHHVVAGEGPRDVVVGGNVSLLGRRWFYKEEYYRV